MPFDKDGRPIDLVGRTADHRLCSNAVLVFRAVPHVGKMFVDRARLVPKKRTDGVGEDGGQVTCVCGAVTAVEMAQLVECAGTCGRWFLSDGTRVHAAMFPIDEAA